MTYNEKKNYLSSFAILDAQINAKLKEKESWISRVLSLKSNSRECFADVESKTIIEKIEQIEREIVKDIDTLVDLREEILSKIETLEDEVLKQILYSKYILGKPFSQIGEEICYCEKQIGRLHKKAVSKLEI
ncbi:MAG: hypothetical protein IJD90_02855 [Clostridia bacterium]|nr:hypothetical protein [Clostridia bacterium]